MSAHHSYAIRIEWTGDRGEGTASYRAYGRDHRILADGKSHAIDGSSDRTFHGDAERWNPEELVISALAQCHMLSYLHIASTNGLVVVDYTDDATGTLETVGDGGRLTEATLRPIVTLAAHHTAEDADRAGELHERASELCFIANSVSFPVHHEVRIVIARV
ncbi:OsmC family protein [Microcella alkalica]|uniref:Organic hydroperoxide reductase OsmC/OhrA n=1 Tax=Microcella alkalica TaxID=355930 RepID=A0A839E6P1_9MICO|nr:organic hydroperoxide reductase OsmC/OhrA [Microcella alkalica]